jgi:hypothetical protein
VAFCDNADTFQQDDILKNELWPNDAGTSDGLLRIMSETQTLYL